MQYVPCAGMAWPETEESRVDTEQPGIQPADVEELIARGATEVVLSRGMELRLLVDPATLELLDQKSIKVHVAETREAVRIYNQLSGRTAVGGLFHSTC
jgi:hypothetical protein